MLSLCVCPIVLQLTYLNLLKTQMVSLGSHKQHHTIA